MNNYRAQQLFQNHGRVSRFGLEEVIYKHRLDFVVCLFQGSKRSSNLLQNKEEVKC